jgi:hypothetical protein
MEEVQKSRIKGINIIFLVSILISVVVPFLPLDFLWERPVLRILISQGLVALPAIVYMVANRLPYAETVRFKKVGFADMLLAEGKTPSGDRVLEADTVRLMRRVAVPESVMPGNQRWGLGMRVICAESYARLPVGCYGWSGAYGTHFWIDPENEIVGIYMKNSRYDGGSGAQTAANFEKDVYL